MRFRRICLLILIHVFLTSACGFWPLGGEPSPGGISSEDPSQTPPGTLAEGGDQPQSPSNQATYTVNLPLLANAGQPEADWQLVPQESEAVDENLNLRIQTLKPQIEAASSEASSNFNQAVNQLVEAELNIEDDLGGVPIQDPGGFLLLGYQVTSAPDWQAFEPYTMSDNNPGALNADQVLLNSGHQVLGIVFEIVSYFGGAHPGSHHRGLNYSLTEARVLSLDDLFAPGSNYLDVIAAYSIQELAQTPEILFEDFEQGAAPAPENYRVWSLTPNGLLVVFEEYQVAPYAAGPQYVVVPYPVLAQVLDPGGPLGTFAQ